MPSSLGEHVAEGPALRALYHVVAGAGRREPTEVAALAGQHARALLGVSGAGVYAYEPSSGYLRPLYQDGEPPDAGSVLDSRPGEGLVGIAFSSRRPIMVPDYRNWEHALAPLWRDWVGAALAVPMLVDGDAIGCLAVWSREARTFADAEQQLLSVFAAQVAPVLEVTKRASENERQARSFRVLHEMALAAAGVHRGSQLGRIAVDQARDLLGADGGFLAWLDPEDGELFLLAHNDLWLPPDMLGFRLRGASRFAFDTRQPVVVEDYQGWEHAQPQFVAAGQRSVVAVPLLVGDRALGALGVKTQTPRRFGPDDVHLLQLIASQVAPTLEAARLLEERDAQLRGLIALHEVAVAASGVLDAAALGKLTVDHARELLGVDSAAVRWWDPATRTLKLLAANDRSQGRPAEEVEPDQGVLGEAFQRQEPVVKDGYAGWDGRAFWTSADGLATALAVPLMVGLRPVGALGVATHGRHRYDQGQVRLLSLFAAQIAPALEAARLAEEREHQARTLRAVGELAAAAGGVLEPVTVARIAVEKARQLLGADSAGLAWREPGLGLLRTVSDDLPGGEGTLESGEGVLGRAHQQGRPVSVSDLRRWRGRAERNQAAPYRSAMAVPLLVHDESLGALVVRSLEPRRFAPEEIRLLSLLAAQVAPALEAARLHADLAASERQLRSVYAAIPCGVVVQDADGRVVDVNDAACAILGLRQAEVLGQPWKREGWTAMGEDGRPLERGELPSDVARRTGHPVRSSLVRRASGRRELWLQVDSIPVLDAAGCVRQLVTSLTDVTAVREAEAVRRESEAKSRFLAAMSHELRTPLNSILGFAQLLQRPEFGQLGERQRRYVDNIEAGGHHLLELVNDVLDLSKVAAGQLTMHLEDFEAAHAVRETLARLRPLADERELELRFESRGRQLVHGDRLRFEQVLSNLVSNAIKFTPVGGWVRVSVRSLPDAVEVAVADNGIGIPSDQHERVFQEFTQVQAGRSRPHQGTGLGLPLSRRLVELMGGEIRLESVLGSGSTFTVTLPRGSSAPAQARRSVAASLA